MEIKKRKVKKGYKRGAKRLSLLKRKSLLLLLAGITLTLAHRPGRRWKVALGRLSKEWEKINRRRLREIVKEFYYDRLISYKEKQDGNIEIVLTEKGKLKALEGKIEELEIKKPEIWDKHWRVVIFDIPEEKRQARDALRRKLKELGFLKIQKSVFILPYECKDEIDFVVEVFGIRKYVRYMKVREITNEEELLLKFNLKKWSTKNNLADYLFKSNKK